MTRARGRCDETEDFSLGLCQACRDPGRFGISRKTGYEILGRYERNDQARVRLGPN